jgi:hypothetical protein
VEVAMENHVKGAVETRVATENHAESAAETRKEWITPELRKIDIEEITANGDFLASDAMTSS